MAVGDIVGDLQSIALNAFLVFQPAAGVKVLIMAYGSASVTSGEPRIETGITDGTNTVIMSTNSSILSNRVPAKIPVDNTIRLSIKNTGTATHFIGFSGIQI